MGLSFQFQAGGAHTEPPHSVDTNTGRPLRSELFLITQAREPEVKEHDCVGHARHAETEIIHCLSEINCFLKFVNLLARAREKEREREGRRVRERERIPGRQ